MKKIQNITMMTTKEMTWLGIENHIAKKRKKTIRGGVLLNFIHLKIKENIDEKDELVH